jgi:hypothetical protein
MPITASWRNALALPLACLMAVLLVTPASAQRPGDDVALEKDAILRAVERDCRDVLAESSAGSSAPTRPVVAHFLARALEPDIVCTCSTRHMRTALDTGRVDPFDRLAVDDHVTSALGQCMQEGMLEHFDAYCDALFVHFYGDEVLDGPHASAISDFCRCTRTELVRVPPERFPSSLDSTIDAGQRYRDEGILEDKRDGSMASAMAHCGIIDLKRTLIESALPPAAR